MKGLSHPNSSGNKKYKITIASTITAIAAKAYMRRERFFSLGLSASERFFRHRPDFVRSLSFHHLPFLTVGTGKGLPSVLLLLFSVFFLIYLIVQSDCVLAVQECRFRWIRRKLKLSLLSSIETDFRSI